jgi:hypothetical protein
MQRLNSPAFLTLIFILTELAAPMHDNAHQNSVSGKPYILALDIASRTGFAHGYATDKPIIGSKQLSYSDMENVEIFAKAAHWIATLSRDLPITDAFIEAPIAPQVMMGKTNPATSLLLLGLFGVISGHIGARGIRIKVVPVPTWRKAFLGAGMLKSKDAKDRSLKQCANLGWSVDNHDAAEAAGIWFYGTQVLHPLLRMGGGA